MPHWRWVGLPLPVGRPPRHVPHPVSTHCDCTTPSQNEPPATVRCAAPCLVPLDDSLPHLPPHSAHPTPTPPARMPAATQLSFEPSEDQPRPQSCSPCLPFSIVRPFAESLHSMHRTVPNTPCIPPPVSCPGLSDLLLAIHTHPPTHTHAPCTQPSHTNACTACAPNARPATPARLTMPFSIPGPGRPAVLAFSFVSPLPANCLSLKPCLDRD